MPQQMDRAGAYIATITESAFSTTAKGLPQWVGKLLAVKRYITDKDEMASVNITEPAFVDWNYGDTIIAYLCLFNADGKELLNFAQLCLATGWDGLDFQTLDTLVGKEVLIRVEEDTYKDKTTLKVRWIDAADASPDRSIQAADPKTIAEANAKFLKARAPAPKPVTAAKPALPKPAPAASTASTADAPATNPAPSSAAPVVEKPAAASGSTTKPPGGKGKAKTLPPAGPAAGALPATATIEEAWNYVSTPAVKGKASDGEVEDAWIAATASVGPNVEQETFTGEMWAKVRDTVIKELAAQAK